MKILIERNIGNCKEGHARARAMAQEQGAALVSYDINSLSGGRGFSARSRYFCLYMRGKDWPVSIDSLPLRVVETVGNGPTQRTHSCELPKMQLNLTDEIRVLAAQHTGGFLGAPLRAALHAAFSESLA